MFSPLHLTTMSDDEPGKRPRAPRLDILENRAALKFLLPIHQKMEPWHTHAARLDAMARSGRAHTSLYTEVEKLSTLGRGGSASF